MDYQKKLNDYVDDVLKGRIPTGQYTKKAVKRFKNDLAKSKQAGFMYEFRPELAEPLLAFSEELYIPDIQKKLELLPWMVFIFYNLYGWALKTDNSVRRFRRGYVEVARKNSKTTSILNPLILYDFLTTPSAESYLVSKDEQLSKKSYEELKKIIKATPDLAGVDMNMTTGAISWKNSRISYFEEKSAAVDGYRNSLSIIDEYHAYDSDRIITAFQKGGRARKNCLTLAITSAGNDISKPCYSEHLTCKKILDGLLTDEQYFGIIYAVDEGDDWEDESCYIKANPSLGTITRPEALHSDLIDAQTKPHHKGDFLAKTLGRWTSSRSNWIPLDKIEANESDTLDFEGTFKRESGIVMAGALDLASVRDLAVFTLCGMHGKKYYFKHWVFIPSETVEERYKKDNSDFLKWIDEGFITVCNGASNDFDMITERIIGICAEYNVTQIGYDRWQANDVIHGIDEERADIALIEIDQNLKNFSPITKEYEKAVYDGLVVEKNPVAKWCLSNAVVLPDNNGNYKPLKESKSSAQRIDCVITSIMALSLLKTAETPINRTFDEVLSLI